MSKKVYWDKGHGGTDPGAVGNGLQEKNVVNTIVNYADKYIKANYEGVVTRMSRAGDQTRSLSYRTNDANKWGADALVSVHINAGGGTGFETFRYNGPVRSTTRDLQNKVHAEVMKAINKFDSSIRDRGRKSANFHMLRESKMSGVLTEVLFIDTVKDAKLLKNNAFLKAVGEAHAIGVAKHLGLKAKKKKSPSKPDTGGTMYRVITGSFKSRSNANDRIAVLKKAGFDSFIDPHKGMYRVVTGSFSSRSNANSRISALKKKGFDSFIDIYKK